MQRITIAATAVAGALAFLPAAAHADPADRPIGPTCGFVASDALTTGPITDEGGQVGEIHGGPLVIADRPGDPADLTDNPVSGTLTCAIQVGGTGAYTDPDVTSPSVSGTGVLYLPPTLMSFNATASDFVAVTTTVCETTARGESTCWYYDTRSGHWTTDESQAYGGFIPPAEFPPSDVCELAAVVCNLPV